jgi:hypothetical protein
VWPHGLKGQAGETLFSHSKRKRITEQQIREYLGLLRVLPIRVESQSMIENVNLDSLSRRLGLAAYPHLAQRTNLLLATSDGPLRNAAITEPVVVIGYCCEKKRKCVRGYWRSKRGGTLRKGTAGVSRSIPS